MRIIIFKCLQPEFPIYLFFDFPSCVTPYLSVFLCPLASVVAVSLENPLTLLIPQPMSNFEYLFVSCQDLLKIKKLWILADCHSTSNLTLIPLRLQVEITRAWFIFSFITIHHWPSFLLQTFTVKSELRTLSGSYPVILSEEKGQEKKGQQGEAEVLALQECIRLLRCSPCFQVVDLTIFATKLVLASCSVISQKEIWLLVSLLTIFSICIFQLILTCLS